MFSQNAWSETDFWFVLGVGSCEVVRRESSIDFIFQSKSG